MELFDVVSKLGGDYSWNFNEKVTHYVHYGNQVEENFKEFKQIKQANIPIVSPMWLYEVIPLQK